MLQVSVQLRKMTAAKALSARWCLNITNTNQTCLFIFVKTNISSIDWELTLHIVLDTCNELLISALRFSHVHVYSQYFKSFFLSCFAIRAAANSCSNCW